MQHSRPSAMLRLEPAIDTRPLTVAPDTLLIEAIAVMGKAKTSCVMPSLNLPPDLGLMSLARASCLLVVENSHLVGVFTQRDAVRVIASGRNLAQVKITEAIGQAGLAPTLSEAQDIFTALSLLQRHQICHLPVLDDKGELVGVVTPESIRQALQLDELLKSRQLAEVMITSVIQAPATASAQSLAELMAENQVDCIAISAADSVGIVTNGDIIQLHALKLDLSETQAGAVMREPVLCMSPSDSVLVAHWEMQQRHMQQLVVLEKPGELLGIVTPTSCLQKLDITEMYTAVEALHESIEQFAAECASPPQSSHAKLKPPEQESPAQLLEQLERNRLLTAIALRIRESLNLDEILNTAVSEVRQLLQTDRAIIYRFNPDSSGTVVVESVADGWQPALGSTVKDDCFGKDYAQSYQKGRIQVTEDVYTAGLTQCHIDILALFDIRANLVVPILQGEHLWGLLCASHCCAPRRWREFEVDLLKQLSTQIAIAIQQSSLFEQVQAELAERKRAQEQLKASLKEKEVLLKEIHHRVKNNLQIISSLLKLQSTYIKDSQIQGLFKDSQNRIRSMALIHEKLYKSKDLSKIDFAEYIRDLTVNLLRSYNAKTQNVQLKTTVNDIKLNIDTAIPCGLIINELISNSLKHAFTSASIDSELNISIYSNNDDTFTLIVSDNGVGLPPDLDFQNTDSLGLELVCTLTEQLEGTIELEGGGGTTFKITFTEIGERTQ